MGIMEGLMAGANFGQGYVQGQARDSQAQYLQQIQALSLHEQQQQAQQNDLKMKNQQALSDYSMAQSAGLVPPPGGMPGQGGQDSSGGGADGQASAPAAQQFDPEKYFNSMASKAASMGDFSSAGMFSTQAVNSSTEKLNQQQKGAAVEAAGLKRIQMAHSTVAQILGNPSITTPEEFEQAKMEVLSNPIAMSDPSEAKALAGMQWSPGIVDKIRSTGMTSAQQATDKLRQLKDAQTADHQNVMESNAAQRLNLERQRTAATIEHQKVQAKAGAIDKAPSSQELKVASPLIAQALFPDAPNSADTESLMQGPSYSPGANGKETKYDFNSPMITTIVGRAKQAMAVNRALTFNQAVTQQAQLAKDSGEFQQTTTPAKPGGIFGIGSEPASTSSKFNAGDGSTAHPNIFHGQAKEDLIVGQHYQTGSGNMMWTKEGWVKQ